MHPVGNYDSGGAGVWGSTSEALNSFRGGPLLVRRSEAAAALQILSDMCVAFLNYLFNSLQMIPLSHSQSRELASELFER